MNIPRQYALVELNNRANEYEDNLFHRDDRVFIFLGEIPNMEGHCVIIGHITGAIYSGFHTERFSEIKG